MIVFASFCYRIGDAFWIVVGSSFGALGGQQVAKRSPTIDAEIGSEKSVPTLPSCQKVSPAVARMGFPP